LEHWGEGRPHLGYLEPLLRVLALSEAWPLSHWYLQESLLCLPVLTSAPSQLSHSPSHFLWFREDAHTPELLQAFAFLEESLERVLVGEAPS
jgi:hypothetical protein